MKIALTKEGFQPVFEADNRNKPGYKCWIYEASPAFLKTLTELSGKGEEK